MIGVFRTLLAALLLSVAALAASAEGFVEGVEDLPLMPGLQALPGAGIAFAEPQGRIVVGYAEGRVDAQSVLRFYTRTLPELGWSPVADDGPGASFYRRESDRLTLELFDHARRLIVRFTVSPQP